MYSTPWLLILVLAVWDPRPSRAFIFPSLPQDVCNRHFSISNDTDLDKVRTRLLLLINFLLHCCYIIILGTPIALLLFFFYLGEYSSCLLFILFSSLDNDRQGSQREMWRSSKWVRILPQCNMRSPYTSFYSRLPKKTSIAYLSSWVYSLSLLPIYIQY